MNAGRMKTDEWLRKLRENLRTQDNRATSHPVFIVQQRERVFGVSRDYADGFIWVDVSEGCEDVVDPDEVAWLDSHFDEHCDEPEGYDRLGYVDRWSFVTACFTEEGAKAYLSRNGHNLVAPRIYVESAHRNVEWQRVEALLRGEEEERR